LKVVGGSTTLLKPVKMSARSQSYTGWWAKR